MGTTESIPIERTDHDPYGDSLDPDYSDELAPTQSNETNVAPYATFDPGENHESSEARSNDERTATRTIPDNAEYSNKDEDKKNLLNKSSSKFSKLPQDSKSEAKKFHQVRQPAQRNFDLTKILKDVEHYKLVVQLSATRKAEKNIVSKKEKRSSVSNKSDKISSKTKKREEEQISADASSPLNNKQDSPKRTKRALKPSAKRLEAEDTSNKDESESSSNHEKKKQKASKAGDKEPVLRHILFSTEACENSAKEEKKEKAQDEARDDPQDSKLIFNSYLLKSPSETPVDTVGPPRTLDQCSGRVRNPHCHDVLMGRGNGVAQFPGNQVFRGFCWNAREAYHKAMRNAKGKVAEEVIMQVMTRNPPGRFLERQNDGFYTEVPHDRVKEKICQALREKKWNPSGKEPPEDFCGFSNDEKYEPPSPQRPDKKSAEAKAKKTGKEEKMEVPKKPVQIAPKPSATGNVVSLEVAGAPPTVSGISAPIALKTDSAKVEQHTKLVSTVSSKSKEKYMADHPLHKVGGVGSRITVYWPLDDAYYDATVLQRVNNSFYLKYDDQEIEWLDLSKHKFKVLEPRNTELAKTFTNESPDHPDAKIVSHNVGKSLFKPVVKKNQQLPVTLKHSKPDPSQSGEMQSTAAVEKSSLISLTPPPAQVKKHEVSTAHELTPDHPITTRDYQTSAESVAPIRLPRSLEHELVST